MRLVALDTETGLIAPGVIAPPLVCGSLAWRGEDGGVCSALLSAADTLEAARELFAAEDTHVIGQNIAYDLLVLVCERPALWPLVRGALDQGRVHDTMLREQLLDIARGGFRFLAEVDEDTGEVSRVPVDYSLGALAQRRLGRTLDKGGDGWRLRYLELLAVPLERWEPRARDYAVGDAVSTLEVHESQDREPSAAEFLADESAQVRAAFALHATGGRGLCVDLAAVDALAARLGAQRDTARAALASAGIYRANGTRNLARVRELVSAAYQAKGAAVPTTESGEVSTAADVCRESGDASLVHLADGAKVEKLLTAFVPGLRTGAPHPLTSRYNVLVESGRTSCAGVKVHGRKGVNVQQLPREGDVRDVFTPRPGYLLCSVDYAALELRTLAQVCLDMLGQSKLAEAFRAGRDPHLELAAEILGLSFEEVAARHKAKDPAVKKARQNAKPANFGFPGGLGARVFVEFAWATYGARFTLEEAQDLRARWQRRWPEVPEFQAIVSANLDPVTETCTVVHPRSGRHRAGCKYTEACNSFFQGLAADGAKAALWRVVRDGLERDVHPVAFIHDEVLAEVPEATAHESALWIRDVMVATMSEFCPDVPIDAEPALARRWYKAMEPVRDADGRLIPWTPAPAKNSEAA